jgi:hypothetical protein
MGPTYFWFQWQTLREIAESFGLAPAEADRALRAMLDGAVRTFFDAGLAAEQVLDLGWSSARARSARRACGGTGAAAGVPHAAACREYGKASRPRP